MKAYLRKDGESGEKRGEIKRSIKAAAISISEAKKNQSSSSICGSENDKQHDIGVAIIIKAKSSSGLKMAASAWHQYQKRIRGNSEQQTSMAAAKKQHQ